MARKIVQDDKELLQISQMELKKLQRQYRIMERDKNSYASEIKCQLHKQRKIIETLTKEEANLISRLAIEKADTSKKEEKKKISEMTKTYEKYLALIEEKRKKIAELDENIAKLRNDRKVIKYYNDTKTCKMDESIKKSAKQIQLLQDKLYNETVKYDKLLAENATSRQAVDSLLKDRARFNQLYRKLVTKLNSDKKKLLALIDQASVACEQKDEADEKLKATLHKEEQQSIAEKHNMRELHRQLDHLSNLKEFISVKSQKRIPVDLQEKEMRKKQEKAEEIESYLRKHESILEQLKEFCDESDAEKLSAIFTKQEEENFALFNYVNEINNEVENLREEFRALQISLEEQQRLTSTDRKEQSTSLDSLQKELEETKDANEQLRKDIATCKRMQEEIFNEIGCVFASLKDSCPSLVHLLDTGQKYATVAALMGNNHEIPRITELVQFQSTSIEEDY